MNHLQRCLAALIMAVLAITLLVRDTWSFAAACDLGEYHPMTDDEVVEQIFKGRDRFVMEIAESLPVVFENGEDAAVITNLSLVHGLVDEFSQAFILAQGSRHSASETRDIGEMVTELHYFDDLVDRVDMEKYPRLLELERTFYRGIRKHDSGADFETYGRSLRNAAGKIAVQRMLSMLRQHKLSRGLKTSLWRILYGAIIQRSEGTEIFSHANRYFYRATEHLDKDFRDDLRDDVDPLVYWITTKTALEAFVALEDRWLRLRPYKSALPEVLNIFFAPLLFYQDIAEEKSHPLERVHPELIERVSVSALIKMLDVARKHYPHLRDDRRAARIVQMRMLIKEFKATLPSEIYLYYQGLLVELEATAQKVAEQFPERLRRVRKTPTVVQGLIPSPTSAPQARPTEAPAP